MQISARADYAVRAMVALAADGETVKAESLADEQGLPRKFLEAILADLRRSGLVASQRGPDGGHRLARAADEISVADIMRAVDGPLAAVRGKRPEDSSYEGVDQAAADGLDRRPCQPALRPRRDDAGRHRLGRAARARQAPRRGAGRLVASLTASRNRGDRSGWSRGRLTDPGQMSALLTSW